jgi:hypothetical protein
MRLYRPVTVLVGVLFVLAGGLVRLAMPEELLDDPFRKPVRAAIGEPIVQDGFTFSVVRVRAAQALVENPNSTAEEPLRTNGIFLTVEYQVEGRRQKDSVGEASVKSGSGVTYRPVRTVTGSVNIPPPGFTESDAVIFEVNPDDMAGLTLHVQQLAFFTVTNNEYIVDLGIPTDEAGRQMVERAAKEYVTPDATRRVTQ